MATRKAAAAAAPAAETSAPTTISPKDSVYDQLLQCVRMDVPDFAGFGADEDPKKFIARLMGAVSKVEESTWDALPHDGETDGEAMTWFNNAVDDMKASKAIAPLPGMPEPAAVADAAPAPAKKRAGNKLAEINAKRKAEKELRLKNEAAGKPDTTAPKAPAAEAAPKGKPGRKPKAEGEKKPKAEKKPREPRTDGIVIQLRKIVLANLDIKAEELLSKAKAANLGGGKEIKRSTCATVITDTLSAYRTMKEMGMLK